MPAPEYLTSDSLNLFLTTTGVAVSVGVVVSGLVSGLAISRANAKRDDRLAEREMAREERENAHEIQMVKLQTKIAIKVADATLHREVKRRALDSKAKRLEEFALRLDELSGELAATIDGLFAHAEEAGDRLEGWKDLAVPLAMEISKLCRKNRLLLGRRGQAMANEIIEHVFNGAHYDDAANRKFTRALRLEEQGREHIGEKALGEGFDLQESAARSGKAVGVKSHALSDYISEQLGWLNDADEVEAE